MRTVHLRRLRRTAILCLALLAAACSAKKTTALREIFFVDESAVDRLGQVTLDVTELPARSLSGASHLNVMYVGDGNRRYFLSKSNMGFEAGRDKVTLHLPDVSGATLHSIMLTVGVRGVDPENQWREVDLRVHTMCPSGGGAEGRVEISSIFVNGDRVPGVGRDNSGIYVIPDIGGIDCYSNDPIHQEG
ncbi:hypothetical protein D3C71_1339800 [compost metagenome]